MTTLASPGQLWHSCSQSNGVGSGFDAPTIDRFMPADRRILGTIGFLLGSEDFLVFVQGPLIARERDDVIGLIFR
jgi:hypothetical protein